MKRHRKPSVLEVATRKTRAPSRNLEHIEQSLFIQRATLDTRTKNLAIAAVPNGGWRSKATAAKLKAEGVSAGVPDVLVFDPSAVQDAISGGMYVQYVGLAIEFKVKPNKPTPSQLEWHDRLRRRGWRVTVAYSAEEAFQQLADYCGFAV